MRHHQGWNQGEFHAWDYNDGRTKWLEHRRDHRTVASLLWWLSLQPKEYGRCLQSFQPHQCLVWQWAKELLAASGATSLLPKFVDDLDIRLKDFENCALISSVIETSDVTGGGPELFLYQSGYLTIKGYMSGTYLLGIPNHEVRQALNEIVLPALSMRKSNDTLSTQAFLNLYMDTGNLPEAMR